VEENIAVYTSIARVSATDNDAGDNAHIQYSLSSSTQASYGDIFAINSSTGEIFIVGTVDYEKTPVYHLIITAQDGGMDAVLSETTLIVHVDDVNDNSPSIVVNTLFAADTDAAGVIENAPSGTFVGHVIVNDPDRGVSGQFSCNVNIGDSFRLDQVFAKVIISLKIIMQ